MATSMTVLIVFVTTFLVVQLVPLLVQTLERRGLVFQGHRRKLLQLDR